ncbi:MAG: hypothetical protein QXG44_11520 [Candidatus Jordarchaeaceae archaeon]
MVILIPIFLVALLKGQTEDVRKAEEMESVGKRKTTTPRDAFELFLGAKPSKHWLDNKLVSDP